MTAATDSSPADSSPAAQMTALDMVRNLVRHVSAYAQAADVDPLAATVNRFGARQAQCAETAAHLALASIAEDVHTLTAAIVRTLE